MSEDLSFEETKKEWNGSYRSYLIGFISSLLLTLISFFLVISNILPKKTLIVTISILAVVQALCQLEYFLHVGDEEKPRWETVVFYFMVIVLLIVAIGSLWIMYDLNERMMTWMPHD